ncbi:MAG: hypothetical protein NT172_04365 [Planctomycetota bacterium]|nr:hypothetical protein [Planctomycetota bacterium]
MKASELIIAQSTNTASADAMLLALKRWVSDATLTSPDTLPSPDFQSRFWFSGLLLLLLFSLIAQGPKRFFTGLFQWSDLRQLFQQSYSRLRSRPIVPLALGGMLLISWTTSQLLSYNSRSGSDELQMSLRSRTLPVLSLEQGLLAALTPLRDLTNLADCWPMVAMAVFLAFQHNSMLQWVPRSTMTPIMKSANFWSQVLWIAGCIWLVYRMVIGVSSYDGLPLNTGAYIEVVLEPAIMLLIDSFLLAWVLTEIRDATYSENDQMKPDFEKIASLLPGIFLVNFSIAPGRYFAHALWLVWNSVVDYIAVAGSASSSIINYVIWGLSWGILELQVIAFPFVILAGSLAWSQGSIQQTIRLSLRMLKKDGSLIFLMTLFCGLLNIISSAIITTLILSHPVEPWVFKCADSYCHFATLFTGLIMLSSLIEVGERSLTTANILTEID